MSKFPSLQNVINATQKTILRFPLETITAICGTICAILLVEDENRESKELLMKTIMSSLLCLVLFLSISLFFEASKKNTIIRFLTSLALGSIAIAFVFSFKKDITEVEMQQFLTFAISLHLLVSFAGFIPKKYNQDEFWEFNKQLFLRILTAGLYSAVLYLGLTLAITAIKELFSVEIDGKFYGYLFFTIAGIFNTIFFLNGVPEIGNKEFSLKLSYPNGLKNFTQYVLLPLISLYLVILICYETKILITLSLPVGWVSYLVLAFAVFGILSFLLVLPIATQTGNLWMRTFNRWFYYLLVPLLGLLFWAILYRIHLYGFTHERYYVLLLSIWLTIVVVYFIIQKQPKIKFIPISMCIAGLLSIVGPQSADSISKNSQLARFESYMQKTEKVKLSFEQEQDLSSIVDFLEKNYTAKILVPYTKDKLTSLLKKDKNPDSSQIMKALGFQYRDSYRKREREENDNEFYYNLYKNEQQSIENIHGYDMSFSIGNNNDLECKECININNTNYSVLSSKKDYGLDLQINQDTIPLKIVDFVNANPAFDQSDNSGGKIIQKIESPKYSILITYITVSGEIKGRKKTLDRYQIKVLVDIKT
ncbi:protein of unknown function [Flavobacterium fluvii]|uniref:DUF4153 domain-containing protein n=1 Tax=Flavobacterium fluvii TaxID=468056 RepID=A0A1M5DTN0_9FLAO|nr:DUF4153 domain-containing protein [Flavobacterium fluvii]SHF70211.1 protein of unknown function [Flavobacterium fluvii]